MRASLQPRDPFEPLGIAAGGPALQGLSVGDEEPAEPGTFGLVGSHLAVQGPESARAFIAGAGHSHHQIRAEGGQSLGAARG